MNRFTGRPIFSLLFFLLVSVSTAVGQYPFEVYPEIKYNELSNWKTYDRLQKEGKIDFTLTVPNYFAEGDTLTIQVTSFKSMFDTSILRLFRNKVQIQKMTEPMFFKKEINFPVEPLRVADINGDLRKDIKLNVPYMGNGLAALNYRIIYLIQKANGQFAKISFDDKLARPERDFDGDGNFEIITRELTGFENHNYWTFNLYNFVSDKIVNVNQRHGYPIMIQFLNHETFVITDKISRLKMKEFGSKVPPGLSCN